MSIDIASLAFKVDSGEIAQAETRLDSMDKAGSRAERGAGKLTGAFKVLGGAIAAIGIASTVRDALAAYNSYESMSAGLKSVTGSAEAASQAMSEINDFAKTTPYVLEQSLQGYQRLKSLGLDPSTASMRSYGNTATAMRKDMVQMIEAVADATTGEFERLKEFGIKAKKSGDDISFTFQGVTTTVKNSSEDIQGYLQDIGNNQFAGSMDNAMQTVQGAVSNLDDAIFRLQVRFIESTGLGEAYRLTLLDVSDFLNNEGTDAVDAMARAVSTLSFEFDHMGDVWGDTYDELMKENADTLEVMEGSLDDWFNTFGVVMGESLSEFRKNINYMPVTFKAGFESMSLVLESWYLHSVSYWEKFKSMVLYVMASVDVSTGEVFSSMLNMGKDFIGDLIGLYAKFGEFAQKIVGFFGDDTGTTWLSKTLKEGTDSLNESSKAWKSNTSDVSDNAKWLKEQAKSALDSSDRNKAAGIAAMNAAKQVKENAVAAIANYEANRVLDRALKDADESFKGLKSSTSLSTKEIKKAADATGDLKDKKVKLTDAQRDAIRMTESLRTAQEKHDAAIKAATKLLASKHITEETFNREKIRAAKELSDYHARAAKELAKTSTETLSTYERERRALEISKTAKLDGAEAAYRLRLSYDDIRGSQADLLVNLKRQSGAFDEVAKKAVKLTEAQKKAAEDQRLLNSVYAEVATPIDNYNTTKAELNRLSKIEGANLALIQVALKEAHSEYKKTLPSVIENAKAQKELVSVYAQVQTPLESYNKNKARLNELLKVEGADTEMVNRALKKQAEEYKKTTPEYEARTKAAKDLLAVYSSVSTPLEKFNSEKERLNKLSEIEGANIEFINRALKANQLAYDQTVDSIQDKVKFDKHLKDAQESNRTSLDLATKSYGRSEEAVVSLSLQLNSKYGKALADSEAKIITKRVEQEKLNSAYSSAKQAVKDSSEAADLARNSIGKTDEEISALTLSLKVGYNPEMSRAKAANDAAAISYGQIHALIKEMRTPAEQLSHELKSLNDLYDTGELDAETYARAQAAIKESFDENVIAAKELKEEVDRLGNSLTDTLTSSILSGDYEGIGSKLVDTFKNDILNPILDQAIKPFTEALSNSMAGAGNSISGMMGGSKSLFGQSGSGIMSMLSGGGLSGAIGAGGLGMAFGQAIGQSGIGTSIGAAIGNIIMPGIGGIIGGGLGTLVEGIFGGSKETVGTGVQVGYSGDFSGKNYEDWFKKGGWFSSDKEGTNYSAMDSEISETMNGYFTGVKTTIAAQAAIIFQRDIAFYDDILASFVSGSTKLSGSDISAQITSWAEGITDEMYESIFESTFGEFKLAGETLTDTVNRMVVNLDTVKNGFDNLGLAFNHYGASAAIVADGLVQAAGGLDILANNMQTYYDVVYTGEEKTALASKVAKEKIDAFNDAIGLSGDVAIDTFEELKAYVESQNTATESGQQAAAAAFALAESIDVFTGSADDAAEAAEAAAEAAALAMSLLLNELEQMELGISTLISQLYTSSNDAYTAELARYNTLTSAAESLDDTVNNLLGTVENSSASLGQAQRNYNDLLAQAQSGDASVVGDLQSAAATLVDALDSSYGYNDSNALGVAQIAGQLSSVSDVLNRTAGSEPVDPSLSASDLSAIEREALVSELIENLKDLGLAENKSVLSLMTENGVYAENLANDLGIDLDTLRSTNANLSSDQVNKIVYLADSIGLSFADLGRDLGADFGTLKASISSNLASLPDLSSEISTRLTPFLSAIESSNDYTELNDSLLFLRAYASTLPEDIRSNLDSSLDAIIGTTDELANVVDSSSELLRQQVLNAADILSVDIGSLNSATQQSSLEELKELAKLGGLFDLSIASLGSLLGADFDTLGDSIANGLSDLPGLSSEIRGGLEPYLSAIEQSNDSSSLEAILGVTKDYISTLPSDIKDNLSARLDAIVGTGLSTNEAISSLGELNEAQTSILLNSLGSDFVSIAEAFGIDIEELKDSSVNIGDKTLLGIAKLSEETNIGLGSLADNFGIDISRLSQTFAVRIGDSIQQLISLPSYITSGLSPFLESISLASDSTELNDGISNLSDYINSLPAGIKEQLSGQLDELIGANYLIDSSIQGMSLSDTIDIKEQILASGFDIEDLDISSVYGLTGILNDFNVDIYDLIGALNLSVRDISSSVKESIEDTTKNLFEINQGRAWWGGMENEDEFEHEKYAANSELQELVNKVGLATSTTALEVAIENVESFMNAIASSEWITGFDISRMNNIGNLLKSLENEDLEMPSFDIGSDYIASNQVAKIHKGESIFTASQSANLRENTLRIMRDAATRSGSENAMASAISELKDEVASLRRENKAASFELVKHTKRSSNTLTAWNANGMPTEAES